MAQNSCDFASISEEDEQILVYGSLIDSQPIQTEKLSRINRLNSISLNQDDEQDERDSSALIQHESSSQNEGLLDNGDRAKLAFVRPTVITTKLYNSGSLWCGQRCFQENNRVAFASIGLVVLGIVLLGTGVVIWSSTYDFLQAIVFLVIGVILLIPGVYHLIYLYSDAGGKNPYTQYSMPTFK